MLTIAFREVITIYDFYWKKTVIGISKRDVVLIFVKFFVCVMMKVVVPIWSYVDIHSSYPARINIKIAEPF